MVKLHLEVKVVDENDVEVGAEMAGDVLMAIFNREGMIADAPTPLGNHTYTVLGACLIPDSTPNIGRRVAWDETFRAVVTGLLTRDLGYSPEDNAKAMETFKRDCVELTNTLMGYSRPS